MNFEPARRTQHRLLIAMGVAACLMLIVIAAIEVFLDFEVGMPTKSSTQEQRLTVQLHHSKPEQRPDQVADEQTDVERRQEELAVIENRAAPADGTPTITPETRPDQPTPRDWRLIITESVAANRQEEARQEASRSTMWRQTYSVMFQPDGEFVPKEQDPVIPDFRFKPQVHVAGLGFTIGSCFVGIPLVGVPVEERTAAVRLFVCPKG